MQKMHRDNLLVVERRILQADERLTAAQNALEDAKRAGTATPEMEKMVLLIEESLSAMSTYRSLLLTAIRSGLKGAADD